jgi:copper resistance protein C
VPEGHTHQDVRMHILRTTSRVAVALVAAALAIALSGGPAWAHATLEHTDPAQDSTVTTPIVTITLTFNEMVRQKNTVITVSGPDGQSYSDGAAHVVDQNVTQAVKPLPNGAVTVSWTSVAPDGDAISGSFGFTVAVPVASSAPVVLSSAVAPSAPASSTVERRAAGDTSTGGAVGWIVVALVVLGLIAVGSWLWARRRRTRGQ